VSVPAIRHVVVFLAAIAVMSLQVVRAEHIHPAGIEGRAQTLVHSHLPGPATGGPRAYAAHGDHRLAIFLATIYESVLRNSSYAAPDGAPVSLAARIREPLFQAINAVPPQVCGYPPGLIGCASSLRAPPLRQLAL